MNDTYNQTEDKLDDTQTPEVTDTADDALDTGSKGGQATENRDVEVDLDETPQAEAEEDEMDTVL